MTDPEMYLMIQLSVRSGICYASVLYACAKKLIGPLYDPTKATSYIICVDASNFYG